MWPRRCARKRRARRAGGRGDVGGVRVRVRLPCPRPRRRGGSGPGRDRGERPQRERGLDLGRLHRRPGGDAFSRPILEEAEHRLGRRRVRRRGDDEGCSTRAATRAAARDAAAKRSGKSWRLRAGPRAPSSTSRGAELVAEVLRPLRDHPLAALEDDAELAAEFRSRTKPGIGITAGRPSARPSAFENSLLVTGFGAVALTTPLTASLSSAQSRIPTSSSMWIQETYWSPPASGPPTPELERRQQLAEEAAARGRARGRCGRSPAARRAASTSRGGLLPLLDDLGVEARRRARRPRRPIASPRSP